MNSQLPKKFDKALKILNKLQSKGADKSIITRFKKYAIKNREDFFN